MKIVYQLLTCIVAALLLFAYQNEYIIIAKPQSYNPVQKHMRIATVTLQEDAFDAGEQKEIALSGDLQADLQALLNCRLSWLAQEQMHKKVSVEAAMLSPSQQTLFISFDRKPFGKQDSIAQKIHFINRLCDVIGRESSVHTVHFLVRHAPLQDPHLDFGRGWQVGA